MRLFINANENQQKEIRMKPCEAGIDFHFSADLPGTAEINHHDAFLLLNEENNYEENNYIDFNQFNFKPVIVNAVLKRLSDNQLPNNVARINGWPGFLERPVWEIACIEKESFISIFQKLNWEIISVKDEPGMVSARVVSMIINEAFYALKENVSTKAEIDLAMKLGTNYPLGPFEWAEKIGIEKVFDLLNILSEYDKRCTPAFNRAGQI